MTNFVPGQRWISDTETEQGLGTVLTLDQRTVTLLFPATGETRVYATHNCPLTRIEFKPGDRIENHRGELLFVTQVIEEHGLLYYLGNLEGESTTLTWPEAELGNHIRFNKPQDRLLAGQIDLVSNFGLRYKALVYNHFQKKSPQRGLVGPRTSLLPHQLHIASEVANRFAPRVMLADEVGMGKTIEAGMILHQQLLTARASRVLILLPESLIHQWLVEMLRRFNLHFSVFDKERCDEFDELDEFDQPRDNINPFNSEQLILCSLDFLSREPKRQQQVIEAGFDLLVVDEAHHLVWSPVESNIEYQCVEHLSQHIPGLLLLTATPEQMGVTSHFAHLRLLDPNRFHDLHAFEEEQLGYQPVAEAVQEVLATLEGLLPEQTKTHLLNFLGDAYAPTITALESDDAAARETARTQLLNALLDRHGTGRVMFRNTRAAVGGFAGRAVQGYPQTLPELYSIALEEESNYRHNLYPELSYQNRIKVDDMDPWWRIDPRVEWLISLLKLLKREKVLVICAHAETALDLENALRILSGIPAAVFHEHLSIIERDRAAAYFADAEHGAQTLICSEIGSEGRNFQFAHHLVLFDLPEHPDLLEQRIGRLDRIGQKQTIKIHVPYLQSTGQEALFHWFNVGLNAFADTCPAGGMVQQQVADQLRAYLEPGEPVDRDSMNTLLDHGKSLHAAQMERLHSGRDRLLEINSRGLLSSEDVINAIDEQEQPRQCKRFMEKLFEAFGVDTEDFSKHALGLRPGSHMLNNFPGLLEDGMTVTFDREQALSREDWHFLTWEHPMVTEGIDMVLTSELGNTAVALLKNKALPPGTMLLEAVFVIETNAERGLQLDRYLPATPVRCLIDPKLNDLSEKVAFDTLNAQLQPLKQGMAKKVVEAQRKPILEMLAKAQTVAEARVTPIVDEAITALTLDVGNELQRLEDLKAVNPNVRPAEIEYLQLRGQDGLHALQKAVLRLDALRIMVAG